MLREHMPALASAPATVFGVLADRSKVRPPMSVSEWAEANRVVSGESGSRRPGPWRTDPPWAREIMNAMGLDQPCRKVTVRGSAQSTKSECALNAIFSCIDQEPRPMLVVLPSLDEARKWNQKKFEPNCRESGGVKLKVAPQSQRTDAARSSTTMNKNYEGGFLQIAAAGTSKPFQMITVGMIVFEEVAEYDLEAGDRGDVLEQARTRGLEYGDDLKEIIVSTPGTKAQEGEEGSGCRVTDEFMEGSQEWLHTPCPHCGDYFAPTYDRLEDVDGAIGMYCPGCGAFCESHHRFAMIDAGVWIACFEHKDSEAHPPPPASIPASEIGVWAARWKLRLQHRSFQVWRGITRTKWEEIWDKRIKVESGRMDAKVFCQQWLGEPDEPVTERPDWEPLHQAKGLIHRTAHEVPPFVGFLTGAVDVQVDRLEWAVYGWGRGGIGARIEKGEITGEPSDPETWSKLQTLIMEREWSGPRFKPARPVRWGIDSGYKAMEVYQFAKRMWGFGVRPLKGEDGPKGHLAPAIADSGLKKIRIDGRIRGRVRLSLIGVHGLKERVYFGLQAGADSGKGPVLARSILFGPEASEEDFKQLTAEYQKLDDPRYKAGQWLKVAGQRNEQLDLAVYNLAFALGYGLDRWGDEQWEERYRAVMPDVPGDADQAPLEALWQDPASAPPKQEQNVVTAPKSSDHGDALARASQQIRKWNRKT